VRLSSLLTHDIAPFSPLYDTLSLPDGSLTLTFLPAGSLSLRFWLTNCAVFVPFTCPFGSKTLTSYSTAVSLPSSQHDSIVDASFIVRLLLDASFIVRLLLDASAMLWAQRMILLAKSRTPLLMRSAAR